jgi:hypothetical protein
MNCKICSAKSENVFSAKILHKYNINYYHCSNCGFLQTEEPHWLEESYGSAIGIEDTGLLKRNFTFVKTTSVIINSFFNKGGAFLDYAGGYGIFVRLMRDIGFDFYWSDPFAPNLVARGFDFNDDEKIELITAFECFEHFNHPITEIEKMLHISNNVLFSTRVFNGKPLHPDSWWYYSLNSGQHISFYSVNTLKFIADKYQLFLNTDNKSLHLLSKKKINNTYFNLLKKISSLGLAGILNLSLKSKTDLDYELLKSKHS